MKRFSYFAASALIVLFALVVAVLRGVNHMSWTDYTPSQIKDLAIGIEIYKERSGAYPKTLSALKDLDVSNRKYLLALLSGSNGTQYSYTFMDKGFGICAVRTGNFLSESEAMSNYFVCGKLFDSAIIRMESNQPTVSKALTNSTKKP